MEQLMELLTLQFLLFSLVISGITFVVRAITEYFVDILKSGVKAKKFWEDVFLPSMPLILGALMARFMTFYPFPDGLTSIGAHVVWGIVAGMSSGFTYRILRSVLTSKLVAAGGDPNAVVDPDPNVVNSVRDSINKN